MSQANVEADRGAARADGSRLRTPRPRLARPLCTENVPPCRRLLAVKQAPEPRLIGGSDARTRRRLEMRAAKLLAVLAIAALGIGSFSAVAVAAKPLKLKTIVDFCFWTSAELPNSCEPHGQNPTFDKSGLVSAEGVTTGHVTSACFRRSMSLQLLDTNGVVLTTLDRSTSSARGLWKL